MLRVAFGGFGGLPVDVAEVGAPGCAAVEDEEEVAGGAEDDLPDVVPLDFCDGAVSLAVEGGGVSWVDCE